MPTFEITPNANNPSSSRQPNLSETNNNNNCISANTDCSVEVVDISDDYDMEFDGDDDGEPGTKHHIKLKLTTKTKQARRNYARDHFQSDEDANGAEEANMYSSL
ncbi:hypothetical protein NPX13_g2301 [Xylaria arbuscula]|uniref:Uncharacterized protein n=1 Tax=Xylaria arbuscula TaxID=114810 RepID=A0A9W8NK14_9PEZI|nr:hypothetical protein NPX13_g2301 [Xylaria arbuscula]